MSEYEPVDLERDSRRMINELTDVGRTAGLLVSRAALERGDHDQVTEMFDNVAQAITVALLKFQYELAQVERPSVHVSHGDHVEGHFVSDGL